MWLYRGRSSSSKQVLRGGKEGGGWQDDLLLVNRERERNKKVNNHHHPLTKRGRIFLLKHPFVPGAASQEELAKTEELRSCEIATIGAKPPKRTTKRKSPGKILTRKKQTKKEGKTALPLSQPEDDFPPRHSRAEGGNSLSPLHHFFVCFCSLDFYFFLSSFPSFLCTNIYVSKFSRKSSRLLTLLKVLPPSWSNKTKKEVVLHSEALQLNNKKNLKK